VQASVVFDDKWLACKAHEAQRPSAAAERSASPAAAPPPSGKSEQVYANGSRKVTFANGTCKYTLPHGLTMVQFVNGDMKKTAPGGTVEYFYREVDTWHTTLASGVEVRGATLLHLPCPSTAVRLRGQRCTLDLAVRWYLPGAILVADPVSQAPSRFAVVA
jgi:T-complex protein 10 C-terminus